MKLDQEITSGLLECVDAIREVLQRIETTGVEGAGDYRKLNDRLAGLAKKEQPSREPPRGSGERKPEAAQLKTPKEAPHDASVTSSESAEVVSSPPAGLPAVDTPTASKQASQPKPKKSTSQVSVTSGSVRVDVRMLDDLMTLVGELVLARNQLLQFSSTLQDPHYQGVTQRVNQITSELQEGIMKTRMQPVGSMWGKFPRVVRDLALSCQKEVRLVMEGQDTELDRTLLEAIKDPLTHLIRNSIDHGIETPEHRRRVGKDSEGTLLLRAFHEGGLVNIEITDDGGGISVEKVKDRAISNGLLTPDQSRRMTDDELVQLIFRPGFSTADMVTDVSGRGVGMDVVRTNIERIGGFH